MINQSNLYYERMHRSLKDKFQLLAYLPKNTDHVIDVGGADGAMASKIKSMQVSKIDVVDAAKEAIKKIEHIDGIRAIHAYADEIDDEDKMPDLDPVDAIIASSVIHEIFSYGNREGNRGKISNVDEFFAAAHDRLRVGGRLLIRDGIRPLGEATQAMVIENGSEYVKKFKKASPFVTQGEHIDDPDRVINVKVKDNGAITGSRSSLFEILFTWNWGEESFDREVLEFYGVFTKDEMIGLGAKHGFFLVDHYSYIQKEYTRIWNEKGVRLSFPYPDTNALWIFEKR